jgi:RHS repeat-associated protein
LDYSYNIRGWLTGINDAALSNPKDLFGFGLSYDQGFDKAYFNGSISGVKWKSYRDNIQRAYGYHYDSLNRLLQADFRAFNPATNTWTAEQAQDQGNFDVSGIGYDLNGNIQSMERRGLQGVLPGQDGNAFGPLDQLRYAYQGNQLKAVDDDLVTPENTADFEDNGSKYKGTQAEYIYDANGNLTADQNKVITGIAYNHLNLPALISFGEKGSMKLVYSAAGLKLRKIVKEAGKPDAITDYSGGFVYQNDTLQFTHTAEGRVLYRPQDHTRTWAYEYHYKDHLGNTRLAFRKQEHEVKIATMEPSRVAEEQQDFDNIVETRSPEHSYNGNYASRLNAAENKPLGPFTMLSVQRGDSLSMSAFAHYQESAQVGKSWTLAAFVSSLFNTTALPPAGTESYRHGKYTPYIGLALGASIAATQSEDGVPIAYLKYIVLNQDSAYVYSDVQVISSAAGQSWQALKLGYKVAQDGFVQVFVYNESGQEVFFDDVTIRKDPALIVQENHYDPWGMNLVGIEMQGRPDHKFQYNGIEKQEDFGLNVDMALYRTLDPQLGRWWQIDPVVEGFESITPYNSNLNNPIRYDDPDGDCPTCITGVIGAGIGGLVGGAFEAGTQLFEHGEVNDWGAVGGSVIQGAITGGVAGLTGGASLLATTGASAAANVVGGAVNNAVQGQEITAKSVAIDAAVGAAAGVGGKLLYKAVSTVKGAGKEAVTITKTAKTVEQQATDLVSANGGINRVTLRSPSTKVDVDLSGKPHYDKVAQKSFPTPHTKVSPRNFTAPRQPAYNTGQATYRNATQQDIRLVRKYLESQK